MLDKIEVLALTVDELRVSVLNGAGVLWMVLDYLYGKDEGFDLNVS